MIVAMNNPTIILYGIPNCDTVRKARAWLGERGAAVQFHDFARQGVPLESLGRWAAQLGYDALLNRRGTTWRRLSPAEQQRASDAAGACALMQAHASLIRRPVVEWPDGRTTVGFDAQVWNERLAAGSKP